MHTKQGAIAKPITLKESKLKFRNLFALLLFSLQLACSNASTVEWFDASSFAQLKVKGAVDSGRLPTLDFQNGMSVDSCSAYLKNSAKSNLLENAVNFSNRAQYLICDAAAVYSANKEKIKLADAGAVRQIAESLCSQLDLSSFPNSLRQTISSSPAVMGKLFNNKARVDKNACAYSEAGRNFVLTAIALERKAGAQPRLMVWLTDEILDGTYRVYQPLWFTKDKVTGVWTSAN